MFNDTCVRYAITAESDAERMLKIGQHLPKLLRLTGYIYYGHYHT